MSENLVDTIEFRATSRKGALPGLDEALAKLRALEASLDAVNGKLAGMGTMSAFKRTKAEMEEVLRSSVFAKVKRGSPLDVAQALGVPDIKDFQQFVSQWKAAHKDLSKTFFQGGEFTSPGKAAEIARKYFTSALKANKDAVGQVQSLFGKGVLPGSGGLPGQGNISGGVGSVTGPISLVIPASQIVATVGPGVIPAGGPSRPGQRSARGSFTATGGSGALLEERLTESGAGKFVQRKELLAAGQTVDKFFRDVDGALQPLKEVTTTSALKRARERLQLQVTAIKSDLASSDERRSPELHRKAADMMESFVEGKAGKELQGLGLGNLVMRTRGTAAGLRAKAEDIEQRDMVRDAQKAFRIREELAKARARGDKEEESRLNSERRNFENQMRDRNRMTAARAKSDAAAGQQAQKVADLNAATAAGTVRRQMSHAGAEQALAEFLGRGGKIVSERTGTAVGAKGPSSIRTVMAALETGTHKETITATFDATGASVTRLNKALSESRAEAGYMGSDFIKNTAKVTAWAASVAVLYKTVELARHSLEQLVEIGPQLGRLEQVFKGVGGSSMALAGDLLEIAAANGQSTKEAMEAGIQWARLGLTRTEVNEAVRQSTMAANVAQISTLEATEKLQAMMQSYGLKVGELRGTLGELVQISNIYNVTNADMLEGLTRTSAVAKQAGLPLVELMGLLGATIGATGQSGSNIGNAVKSITLALSNPVLQKSLRKQFAFEATAGGEEIKGMSAMLSELFVKYQHLNDAQRQSLLFQVAGRTQASRMSAMLDSYVKSQTLAVNAQLNQSAAEMENAKIKDTLASKLKGLTAEWERFVLIQGSNGPVQAMTGIATALKNVITLSNSPGASQVMTGLLGLLAAGGAKSILTGMSMTGGSGFLSRTGTHARQALGNWNVAMTAAYAQMMGGGLATMVGSRQPVVAGATGTGLGAQFFGGIYRSTGQMIAWGQSVDKAGTAMGRMAVAAGMAGRALGMGLIAIRQWAVPLGIIALATYGFNKGMEYIGLSSEKAEAKLAGFNQEAERAKATANAYAEAADLMSTAERALKGEKGFRQMQPEDQKRMLKQLSEGMDLMEPDIKKREQAQEQRAKEFEAMRAQGNIAGIINRLEEERNKLLEGRREQLQRQYVEITKQQHALGEEITRLQGKQTSGMFRGIGYETRAREISAKQTRLEELSSGKVRNLMEQGEAYQQQLQYDEKHITALQKEKMLLDTIAEIYSSIHTNNPLEAANVKVASLNAQKSAVEKHMEMLSQQDEAGLATESEREDAMTRLENREKRMRSLVALKQETMDKTASLLPWQKRSEEPTQFYGGLTGQAEYLEAKRVRDEAKAEVERIAEEKKRVSAGRTPAGELGFASREKQRLEDTEQIKRINADVASTLANMPMAEAQTRFGFGQQQAGRSVGASRYGIDEAQKLLRERSEIQRQLGEIEKKPNATIEDRGRQLELEHLQYQNILSLRERAYTVERDINQLIAERDREFRRSIFGAGPGELLRKLGAFRSAFDSSGHLQNVTSGAMLAMSPEMRRETVGAQAMGIGQGQRLPGNIFDPEMMELFRERERLKGSGFGQGNASGLDKLQLQVSNTLAAIAGTVRDLLPKPELEAGKAAMSGFTSAITAAATAILGELVPAIRSVVAAALPAAAGAKIPATGQYGGRGGGAGYMRFQTP